MKLNPDFLTHTMDGAALVVPTSDAPFHGLVQGNKTVGVILECLEHDTTEQEIVDTLCERYEGDRAEMAQDVADVIAKLRGIGAIDD
ncbi:MAG TPA: hypothetical protein DCY72_00765 [Ruminococcaceae bacterium]|nr:hypothetical protein [Oscillospiraceae bacterium]